MIVDGRGRNKKELSKKNRIIIRKWLANNGKTTITECCRGTGMTYKTVKRHIMAIQAEAEALNEPILY